MTILNAILTMGLPAIDESLQSVITAINSQTPSALGQITSIARVIGLIAALCVASYECWVMMLGRRPIDIFKILRIIGLSFCISASGFIGSAVAAPGKALERTSLGMSRAMNKKVASMETVIAKKQNQYYERIRALQDSVEVAKRIQEIGDDPAWYDKVIYSVKNLGNTIDNFSKRAAITAETKITEWINLVIRFIGECIFQIAYYSLLLMQAVFMKVLLMFAPIAFAMSIAPPWSSAWSQWVSKYATISLWGFLVYLFVFYADFIILYALKKDLTNYNLLIGHAKGTWSEIGTLGMQGIGSGCMYFVAMCVGAVLLKSVPEVASWLIPGGVSSSSAGSAGSAVMGAASAAGGAAMGAAAGAMSVAGGAAGAVSSGAKSAASFAGAFSQNNSSGKSFVQSLASTVASQSSVGQSFASGSINAKKFNRSVSEGFKSPTPPSAKDKPEK